MKVILRMMYPNKGNMFHYLYMINNEIRVVSLPTVMGSLDKAIDIISSVEKVAISEMEIQVGDLWFYFPDEAGFIDHPFTGSQVELKNLKLITVN